MSLAKILKVYLLAMSNEAIPRRFACRSDSVESPVSARVACEPLKEAEVEREVET